MATKFNIGTIDHSGENSRTGLYVEDLDNTNYDTLLLPTTGKYDLLKAGFILLTKLNLTRSTMSNVIDTSVGALPADPTAQRELAMRVTYVDDVTNKKYRYDVPSPVDALIQSGTDVVDIENNVAFTAWKTLFEANAVSPDGNAVTIIGARIVGRSN